MENSEVVYTNSYNLPLTDNQIEFIDAYKPDYKPLDAYKSFVDDLITEIVEDTRRYTKGIPRNATFIFNYNRVR